MLDIKAMSLVRAFLRVLLWLIRSVRELGAIARQTTRDVFDENGYGIVMIIGGVIVGGLVGALAGAARCYGPPEPAPGCPMAGVRLGAAVWGGIFGVPFAAGFLYYGVGPFLDWLGGQFRAAEKVLEEAAKPVPELDTEEDGRLSFPERQNERTRNP